MGLTGSQGTSVWISSGIRPSRQPAAANELKTERREQTAHTPIDARLVGAIKQDLGQ